MSYFSLRMAHAKSRSIVALIAGASMVALVALAATRTPAELGPFGITIWFVLFLTALGSLLTLTIHQIKRVLGKKSNQLFTNSLRQGVLMGIWLTALIALNSLRQLGVKDIVLVSILVVLIDFYLRKAK